MKKLFSILLLVATLVSVLAFSSCGNEEEISEQNTIQYTKIKLTTQNYSQYIAINITYDNCILELDEEAEYTGTKYYNLYCNGNISTAPRGDYIFEKVNIVFNAPTSTFSQSGIVGAYAELDKNGYSTTTVALKENHVIEPHNDFPTSGKIKPQSIDGYVLVPEE